MESVHRESGQRIESAREGTEREYKPKRYRWRSIHKEERIK
uniref:Uncharacterized protein n=1 Tax=Rhizophora mucronata TaxID=61149 RepID=A0A2P2PHS9_RHIMU